MSLEIGSVFEGKVTNVMPFGAFVSFDKNISGMVHISEITNEYVENINDYIKNGDIVKVKVINIDNAGKISLSIKKASEPKKEPKPRTPEKVVPAEIDWSRKADEDMSFEDKLSRFKKDSDERMLALKRSNESKRSGGYHRGGNSY